MKKTGKSGIFSTIFSLTYPTIPHFKRDIVNNMKDTGNKRANLI